MIFVELHTQAHDALHARHGRDRRSLIFPVPTLLKKHNVCVVRIPPSCRFATHVIQSAQPSDEWICLAAYQGHMRLPIAPDQDALSTLVGCPKSLVQPVGWKVLFELGPLAATISEKILGKCPNCQQCGVRPPLGIDGVIVGRDALHADVQLRGFGPDEELEWESTHMDGATFLGQLATGGWNPPIDPPTALAAVQQRNLDSICR